MYRILIVEDNDTRQDFFRDTLAGYSLVFTTTSVEAIELLKQKSFDLIFLDMDLDDGLGRGLDVARTLKGTPNSHSDVIVHSMNISAAAEVKKILPWSQLLTIAELRRMVAKFGHEGFIERILDQFER